jgi:hypothetical protein
METSGQRHVPAALPPVNGPPLPTVQPACGAHLLTQAVRWSWGEIKLPEREKLITHLSLVPKLRIRGAVPPLSRMG